MDELQALAAAVPQTVRDQLDALGKVYAAGPGRGLTDGRDVTGGTLIVDDAQGAIGALVVLLGDPAAGSVGLSNLLTATSQLGTKWIIVDPNKNGEVYLLCLAKTGDRRYLRMSGNVVDLGTSPDASAHWKIEDQKTGWIRLRSLAPAPGPATIYLSGQDGKVSSAVALPFGGISPTTLWKSDQYPPATGAAGPGQIAAEAFWWGFHLIINEDVVKQLVAIGGVVAEIAKKVAPETGPAAPFIELAAAYIAAELNLIQAVDEAGGKKGIYLSMLWLAPAIFVPTPLP